MGNAEKYRVFVQDVGESGYSGFTDAVADSVDDALQDFRAVGGPKFIALPYSRRDLWPHPTTGRVSTEALRIGGAN